MSTTTRVRKSLAGSLAVIAVACVAYVWSSAVSPRKAEHTLASPDLSPSIEPASELNGGFVLTATQDVKDGIQEIRLQSGDISAMLRLAEPTDYAGDEASGRAILSVEDRAAGGRFVAGLARWLGAGVVVDGSAPTGRLPPLYGTYVRHPKSEGWEHYRLLFVHGASRAELLFDLSTARGQGRLIEADGNYRDGIIVFLRQALRDGFTRHQDVAPGGPLWNDFRPVAGENGPLAHAWPAYGGGTWGAITRGRESTVVWWSALDREPIEITKLDGLAVYLVPAPRAKKAVVVLVHPSRDYPPAASGYAANDPIQLVVVDASTAAPVPLIAAGSELRFKPQVLWSPLSTSVAVEVSDGAKRRVRVIDVSNQRDVASSPPAEQTMLMEWTSKGLVYAARDGGATPSVYRWLPEHGEPEPFANQDDRTSPDGKFSFRLAEGAVEVTGPGGVEPLPIIYSETREALAYASTVRASWLGAHQLLLVADDLLELDLGTRQLRYLFPEDRSLLLQGTSPDGSLVIARDETDHLVWARQQPTSE